MVRAHSSLRGEAIMSMRPVATAMAAALCFTISPAYAGSSFVQPAFQLSDFTRPLAISNKFLPMPAGRRRVYSEVSGSDCKVNEVYVTGLSKSFTGAYAGLKTRVIRDQEWLDVDCDGGRDVLLEYTLRWYAQDKVGHVWYFGEDATNYLFDANGAPAGTSKTGSWEAGKNGAIAGIVMLKNPLHGDRYYQEIVDGAEQDIAQVMHTGISVTIGLGTFNKCAEIKEWAAASSGAEWKTYCPIRGLVLVEGGSSEVELISIGR
jgi:hypothetical protein